MTRALLLAGCAALALAASARAQTVPQLNPASLPGPGDVGVAPVDHGGQAGPGALPAPIPTTFPPALPTMSPAPPLPRRERRAVSLANRWRLRSCGTRITAEGVLEVQQGACEPTLVCAPFRWCDVSLDPGEAPSDLPDLGDARWQYELRWAVAGLRRVMHIRFRPTDAGLDSNFVFSTNQRTVSLRLLSQQRAYMPFLHLADAETQERREWARGMADAPGTPAPAGTPGAAGCDGVPVVPPTAFEIDAPRRAAAWAPVQVYGVAAGSGPRTCIEFPADIGAIDLPALVVLDAAGQHQLVTSHLVGRRLEVDALVNRALLVAGVGDGQVKVRISRRDYR